MTGGNANNSNVANNTTNTTTVSTVFHPALNVSNIRNLIPLTLDIDKVQYTPWATLFRNTARAYNVLDQIDINAKKQVDIDDDMWERLDAIVLQWLYGTISTNLLYKILDEKATAMVAWNRLRDFFQDNKGTRVVHLENQFGSTHLADFSSLSDYCQALKTIAVQLAAIDHPVSEERLVLQLVAHLTDEYATIVQQTVPLPSFDKACSMLELDRSSREKNKKHGPTSSAVLLTTVDENLSGGPPQQQQSGGGRNGRGGRTGRGRGKQQIGNRGGGRQSTGQRQTNFQQQGYGPWGNFWAQNWALPPCPYPTMPPQWRGNTNQQQSYIGPTT